MTEDYSEHILANMFMVANIFKVSKSCILVLDPDFVMNHRPTTPSFAFALGFWVYSCTVTSWAIWTMVLRHIILTPSSRCPTWELLQTRSPLEGGDWFFESCVTKTTSLMETILGTLRIQVWAVRLLSLLLYLLFMIVPQSPHEHSLTLGFSIMYKHTWPRLTDLMRAQRTAFMLTDQPSRGSYEGQGGLWESEKMQTWTWTMASSICDCNSRRSLTYNILKSVAALSTCASAWSSSLFIADSMAWRKVLEMGLCQELKLFCAPHQKLTAFWMLVWMFVNLLGPYWAKGLHYADGSLWECESNHHSWTFASKCSIYLGNNRAPPELNPSVFWCVRRILAPVFPVCPCSMSKVWAWSSMADLMSCSEGSGLTA